MTALVLTVVMLANLAGCALLLGWMVSRADGERKNS